MALDITTICKKYDTDKNNGEFPHSKLYDELFKKYRRKATSLLEIGVNRGGSVQVWQDYFPKGATLQGIDIKKECLVFNNKRTHVSLVNQSDKAALIAYAEERGDFNIIIDDGSHKSPHQILTFETLWPYVCKGGIYVVEDTRTSYKRKYVCGGQSCVDYFKSLIDDVNAFISDRPLLFRDIEYIIIKQDMIVITKAEELKK